MASSASRSSPRVSFVVSAYNNEQHLAASLDSILAQTLTDWELIAINDGSTDATLQILNSYEQRDSRIRVIDQENTGLTRALIRGCQEARGEYIARQDGDDRSHPARLARQLELIESRSDLAMVGSLVEYIDDHDLLLLRVDRPIEPEAATRGLMNDRLGPPAHGSMLFRKSDYDAVGGYRACFYYGQDSDLWLRLVARGKIAYVPEVLYWWRMAPQGISVSCSSWQQQFGELGRAAWEARRIGRSDAEYVQQAEQLCQQMRQAKDDPQQKRQLQSAAMYRMGTMLSRQGNPRCRDYFWSVIQTTPWHWKSWCRLTYELVRPRTGANE